MVAFWTQYELLAAAAKLCSVVRDNRLRNFLRHTIILYLSRAHLTAAIFLFVARLLHNKSSIV